jgi:predicted component of type VI protein secretion system
MDASLAVVGGKASKKMVSLKLPTVIGRGGDATLTVVHPMISRRHAELIEVDGLLVIRDLGSLNGTYVDGQRIKEAPLPPNAEFTIGPITFQARYTYTGDLSKLPPPVLAEPPHAGLASTQPWGESPEFEIFNEPPGKPPQTKPLKKSTGDPFDDLLNDL